MKKKPINDNAENLFFAETFLLFSNLANVRHVKYTDIVQAYGEKQINQDGSIGKGEILVLELVNSQVRHYVVEAEPFIKELESKGVPVGKTKAANDAAILRRKALKEDHRNKNKNK